MGVLPNLLWKQFNPLLIPSVICYPLNPDRPSSLLEPVSSFFAQWVRLPNHLPRLPSAPRVTGVASASGWVSSSNEQPLLEPKSPLVLSRMPSNNCDFFFFNVCHDVKKMGKLWAGSYPHPKQEKNIEIGLKTLIPR